jgi:hypothetical protein
MAFSDYARYPKAKYESQYLATLGFSIVQSKYPEARAEISPPEPGCGIA